MALENLSEWLFAEDGDGETAPPSVSPRIGAAGLLVAAAHRDGRYKAMEQDLVTAALMKLFHIGNPDARKLRDEAEAELHDGQRSFMTFAVAAKGLEREDQEALMTHLWRIVSADGKTVSEHMLINSVAGVLGFTPPQTEALRPASGH